MRKCVSVQFFIAQALIIFFVGWVMLGGCTASKDSTTSYFDMSEYRKILDRPKNEQAALESTETKTPQMTPEEHERAGDADAHHPNFPFEGLHQTKTSNAVPS